jgi:hypothetical protein
MIFGFNTDIRVDETVYHVQTEAREQERRMESQVFVSGRCIGKRSSPMPEGAADDQIQEMARSQHRWVVEAVREGFIDDVINQEVGETLAVHFLGAERISLSDIVLQFRVLIGGYVAGNVFVDGDWRTETESGQLTGAYTNDAGVAHMRLPAVSGNVDMEIRARSEGLAARRRFLVKSANS